MGLSSIKSLRFTPELGHEKLNDKPITRLSHGLASSFALSRVTNPLVSARRSCLVPPSGMKDIMNGDGSLYMLLIHFCPVTPCSRITSAPGPGRPTEFKAMPLRQSTQMQSGNGCTGSK